jgi:hypothetical protein
MKRWIAILLLPFAGACSRDGDDTPKPEPMTLAGTLDLEIRDQLEVVLVVRGQTLGATIEPSSGFGLLEPGQPLSGNGRVEPFPEADSTLYTARFSAPARAGGPCGAEPVALALSLHRSGSGDVVAGSLTGYCGAQSYGTPARAPLRLSGSLPLPAP